QALRPAHLGLGQLDPGHGPGEGPRLVAAVLRRVPGHALHGHRPGQLPRGRHRPVHRGVDAGLPRLRPRPGAGDDLDQPLADGRTTAPGIPPSITLGGGPRRTPLPGITMPFVCYGGPSLLANLVILALLLRISDEVARRAEADGAAR